MSHAASVGGHRTPAWPLQFGVQNRTGPLVRWLRGAGGSSAEGGQGAEEAGAGVAAGSPGWVLHTVRTALGSEPFPLARGASRRGDRARVGARVGGGALCVPLSVTDVSSLRPGEGGPGEAALSSCTRA